MTLIGVDLDDRALAVLPQIHTLEALDLSGTLLTDALLAPLTTLGLRSLGLARTHVTATGLAQLVAARQLSSLLLNETALDDHAVAPLSALRRLNYLDVRGTKVSAAGRAEIARHHPRLTYSD